jgi:hypothetical protein
VKAIEVKNGCEIEIFKCFQGASVPPFVVCHVTAHPRRENSGFSGRILSQILINIAPAVDPLV